MAANLVPGGWIPYSTFISADALKVFESVIKVLIGVHYTPLAVSTQVVAGINYRFFANAQGIYPGALNEAVIIQIYQPLEGQAHIISIKKVD